MTIFLFWDDLPSVLYLLVGVFLPKSSVCPSTSLIGDLLPLRSSFFGGGRLVSYSPLSLLYSSLFPSSLPCFGSSSLFGPSSFFLESSPAPAMCTHKMH
uniref:Uncharacterized protein n=1 Tax=Picea glauca TaxID=3330 RepID=A0A101LWL8_PICGL|nr:hypothetical protein ABT39_MTgene1362 [Picea glauca]QHR89485.1 hypothetical protein Q903MT_gene3506 [Picea sitchensis]